MDLSSLLTKVTETMSVTRSFGPAFERGDTTVIPVALVVAGGGGGGSSDQAVQTDEPSVPAAGGGGFGTISVPIGVYAIREGNVRWVPAVDVTRLAIAAIGLVKLGAKLRVRARRDPKR